MRNKLNDLRVSRDSQVKYKFIFQSTLPSASPSWFLKLPIVQSGLYCGARLHCRRKCFRPPLSDFSGSAPGNALSAIRYNYLMTKAFEYYATKFICLKGTVWFIITGSTWAQEIVWQIIHDGKIDERRLDVRVPFIEGLIFKVKSYPYTVNEVESIETMFTSFPAPRVFKTHLPYDMVPKGRDEGTMPRYIYIMRNPKDVCVSKYHHYRNMPYTPEIPTWDEAFERFMNGRG